MAGVTREMRRKQRMQRAADRESAAGENKTEGEAGGWLDDRDEFGRREKPDLARCDSF